MLRLQPVASSYLTESIPWKKETNLPEFVKRVIGSHCSFFFLIRNVFCFPVIFLDCCGFQQPKWLFQNVGAAAYLHVYYAYSF